MPVIRTQRVFMKNLKEVEFVQHIFGSEFVLNSEEDSMVIKLLQASIPPMALHLLVYYQIGAANFIAEVPVELKYYASLNDLTNEIQLQFTLYQIAGYSTLDAYIQASNAGGRVRLTSTLGLPATDPYVYQIEILSDTSELLLGFTKGIHAFPNVAPNRLDGTADPVLDSIPTAVYIHTDLNSTFKNLDNLTKQDFFDKSDIFAKCEYINTAGGQFSYYYDGTMPYFVNMKSNTLSQLNFFITDLNRAILHPQKDWGMVCEIEFRRKPDYNDVVANNLLSKAVEYLRNMWLASPPTTMRKGVM
jgi:hypothetical protein